MGVIDKQPIISFRYECMLSITCCHFHHSYSSKYGTFGDHGISTTNQFGPVGHVYVHHLIHTQDHEFTFTLCLNLVVWRPYRPQNVMYWFWPLFFVDIGFTSSLLGSHRPHCHTVCKKNSMTFYFCPLNNFVFLFFAFLMSL